MGLLDDQAKAPGPRAQEAVPERPAVPTRGVKLEFTKPAREKVSMTAGQSREYELLVTNTGTGGDTIRIKVDVNYASEAPDPPEWGIKIWGIEEKPWDLTFTKIMEKEITLIGGGSREITLEVTCPKGARYGDKLTLLLSATSKSDPAVYDTKTTSATARQAMIAVKTSIGHERTVADALLARAKARDLGVFSILVPAGSRGGYIYAGAMNPGRPRGVAPGVPPGRRG